MTLKDNKSDMVKTNIICLYIIKIAKWFNLVMPTIVLFYQAVGMGMQEIFLLKAIYSIAIVAFEIPSGYVADTWGRKVTLMIGSVLGAVGFIIYSFNQAFLGFACAEIILGLGISFVSGADTAMLYDTLKSDNKECRYLRQEGRITATGNFAEALAGVAGGLLATYSLRTPFYFQTIVALSAIPAAFLLKEPLLHEVRKKLTFEKLGFAIRLALGEDKLLRSAILISSFTGTATLTFAWFVQPYFQAAGLPLPLYGVMWTLLNLSVGTTGLFAHRVQAGLGHKRCLVLIVVMISAGYFLAGGFIGIWGIGFLFLFSVVRGIATPVLKDFVNTHCESEVRATILSLRNFIIRINFAIAGPLLGWATDNVSLRWAYWVAGGLYLVFAGASIIFPLTRGHKAHAVAERSISPDVV